MLDQFDSRAPDVVALSSQIKVEISAWNNKWGPVVSRTGAGESSAPAAAAASGGSVPGRVLCDPVFELGEEPIDHCKVFTFTEDQIIPTEALTELLAFRMGYVLRYFRMLTYISVVYCRCRI